MQKFNVEVTDMFIFSIVFSLLIPALMIFLGLLWGNHPPKEINNYAGYRTAMSEKNQETWDFAHKYFCRLWLYIGIPLSILSLVAIFFFNKCGDDTIDNALMIILGVQIVIIIISFIMTEKALRKNFDEDGIRKKFD